MSENNRLQASKMAVLNMVNSHGYLRKIRSENMKISSLYFTSPEKLDDVGKLDKVTDIWSMGVMLYILICG